MVTFQTLDGFALRETSFLTSSPSFQRQTFPQGRRLRLAMTLSTILIRPSQTTLLSTHSWPLSPLDSWMRISSHGLYLKVSPAHNLVFSV